MITISRRVIVEIEGLNRMVLDKSAKYEIHRLQDCVLINCIDESGIAWRRLTLPWGHLQFLSEDVYELPNPTPGSGR